jgi:hypothetical protein
MPTILKNDNPPKRNSTLVHSSGGTADKYVKHQKLLLKEHPQFQEKWVQERIAEDPSILGIGELILKDKERNQLGAGRLDLLFQHPDCNLRYEVEIQLGKTDERHIFRTIVGIWYGSDILSFCLTTSSPKKTKVIAANSLKRSKLTAEDTADIQKSDASV